MLPLWWRTPSVAAPAVVEGSPGEWNQRPQRCWLEEIPQSVRLRGLAVTTRDLTAAFVTSRRGAGTGLALPDPGDGEVVGGCTTVRSLTVRD